MQHDNTYILIDFGLSRLVQKTIPYPPCGTEGLLLVILEY